MATDEGWPGRPHRDPFTIAWALRSWTRTAWCSTPRSRSCSPTTATWASTWQFPCVSQQGRTLQVLWTLSKFPCNVLVAFVITQVNCHDHVFLHLRGGRFICFIYMFHTLGGVGSAKVWNFHTFCFFERNCFLNIISYMVHTKYANSPFLGKA